MTVTKYQRYVNFIVQGFRDHSGSTPGCGPGLYCVVQIAVHMQYTLYTVDDDFDFVIMEAITECFQSVTTRRGVVMPLMLFCTSVCQVEPILQLKRLMTFFTSTETVSRPDGRILRRKLMNLFHSLNRSGSTITANALQIEKSWIRPLFHNSPICRLY